MGRMLLVRIMMLAALASCGCASSAAAYQVPPGLQGATGAAEILPGSYNIFTRDEVHPSDAAFSTVYGPKIASCVLAAL